MPRPAMRNGSHAGTAEVRVDWQNVDVERAIRNPKEEDIGLPNCCDFQHVRDQIRRVISEVYAPKPIHPSLVCLTLAERERQVGG